MDAITGFVYGMSMMFFSMMAWMFWRKGSDRLFRLIMILMLIVDAQCLKDILSFYFTGFDNEENWFLISAADMFIIPFYSFVLMELVKPGWTTWCKAVMLELPFVLLPAIYCVTGNNIYFYILTVWGAVYGLTTFVVMFFLIRRYHRQLKERFSYQKNINLNWLLAILSSCFLILIIWTMSCFVINVDFDDLYMVLSLAIWMFIYAILSIGMSRLLMNWQIQIPDLLVMAWTMEMWLKDWRRQCGSFSKRRRSISIPSSSCRMWRVW